MNRRQKLVQQRFLNDEKAVIGRLQQVYGKSLDDVEDKIKNLTFTIDKLQQEYDWMDPDDPKRAKVKSMIQSKIYQKQYQEQLQKQVSGILDTMKVKQFTTVSDYLDECYTDGFIGSMFDMHGQGVPIISPINQESMVRAVQLESKISQGLYTRLGVDVDLLKKRITAQVSRGISTGMSFADVAKQLKGEVNIGFNKAVRIARTEGHRIQCTAAMDVMKTAKDKGADVVKQWDAALDDRTRESHAMVDGEIREVDKPFSNGLDFPGDPGGGAAEVVNCRCALLQRARWALDEDELQTLQDRAAYFGLDKSTEFEDFKKNYLKAAENDLTNASNGGIISGAISGARNPFGEKAKEHAVRYYDSVRKMKTDASTIARNLGMPIEDIEAVKSYIFLEKHDLGGTELEYFAPDFMMAQSWQRLIAGTPETHDITLINHEVMERRLVNSGVSQAEAHIAASKSYNYSKEAAEYYAKIKKYKKD